MSSPTGTMVDPSDSHWTAPWNTDHLLGRTEAGRSQSLPEAWWRESLDRLLRLRRSLDESFVGLSDITAWLLAVIIARENGLLLGAPGVAKSQITTRLFELLDLKIPPKPTEEMLFTLDKGGDVWELWEKRTNVERETQKQFHYLLSRYTQPEELFGPIEIALLRKGLLVRVNFGLLTGPGVRAAFLDEIFKASSSILNALLTLTQERRHFNWGGMEESDLLFLIGASNELPGAFGGAAGVMSGQDDFQQLYAFLDRFPLRLLVPAPSGSDVADPAESKLAEAFNMALRREVHQFACGSAFAPRDPDMPSINDIICLGRAMLEAVGKDGLAMYDGNDIQKFYRNFVATGCKLWVDNTDVAAGRLNWSISPRKLRSLYKITLAHALVTADDFAHGGAQYVALGARQLRVFSWIWDSPLARLQLQREVEGVVKAYR
jgi:MoxR-like ATPase